MSRNQRLFILSVKRHSFGLKVFVGRLTGALMIAIGLVVEGCRSILPGTAVLVARPGPA